MKKLWQTDYSQNKIVENYCFGQDGALDTQLIPYDIWGSLAHAKMLQSIGILTKNEYNKLHNGLLEIETLYKTGAFAVLPTDEDVHTAIENFLTKKLGTVGEKIHTGRSRNDQVLVDLKLFTKDKLYSLASNCLHLANQFVLFATTYEFVPMPGYTHMQKAMPSSVGLWAASFAESLLDDIALLKTMYELHDGSPLGSGASYGISLPINRELTAKLLGFAKVQHNVLYTQASRGKLHAGVLHGISQIMTTLSKFAQDMLLFTTAEFNFFSIAKEFTSGSSIMPQKKNLDFLEVIRAKTHTIISNEGAILQIIAAIPSGYNADFGKTKSLYMDSIKTVQQTLEVTSLFIQAIKPNENNLLQACTPEIFATEHAFNLVKQGMTFRQAHHIIAQKLDSITTQDMVAILKKTNHSGGPGNLQLSLVKKQIKKENIWWQKKHKHFTNAINTLLKKGGEKNETTNNVHKSNII